MYVPGTRNGRDVDVVVSGGEGRLTKADCNITFLSEKFSHSFPVVRIIFLLCESNISSVAWIFFFCG